jgi:hypothetical protein
MQSSTDYRFSKEHTWVKPGSESDAFIGITPFAQEQLGEIVYADLPAIGTSFEKDEVFGSIEARKLPYSATYTPTFLPCTPFLNSIDEQQADVLYCLGDLVGYHIWPNEVICALRKAY